MRADKPVTMAQNWHVQGNAEGGVGAYRGDK